MKRMRFAAVTCLACLGLMVLSGCGGGSKFMISIVLNSVNGLLTMDETPLGSATTNTLNFTAAVGGDTAGAGVTWTFAKQTGCAGSGLLVGNCGTLTNNAAFGVTYSAPAITATTSVIITATSVTDTTVTKTITLSIVLPPVFATTECNPSGVLPCTLGDGNNAVPYTKSFTFTGGVQPYTYSVSLGALPSCLKLNAASSGTTGTIIGTPCGSGTSQFTITVTDSGGALPVSQVFIITIAPAPKLSVTVAPLPAATPDSRYSGLIATQGGAPPLTWSMPSGTLPPGLSLNSSNGQITGIPIDESNAVPKVVYPATYVFGIQVQDSQLPMPQIAPVPPAPPAQFSITVQAPQPLLISTSSPLAMGATASAYSATLNASGGVPPYTWSVIQGQLPSGLTLSTLANGTGTISGTPILATVANFTIQVSDSAVNPANGNPAPATNSAPFQITINATKLNNSLLRGTYTFLFNGFDSDGPVLQLGSLTADGNGSITSGSIESNRALAVALGGSILPPMVPPSTTMPGSTYAIGSDGRGTMELTSQFGLNGELVSDYYLVINSDGSVRFFQDYTIEAARNKSVPANMLKITRGEGVMKPVSGPASFGNNNFAGNYAFVLPGFDLTGKTVALAGVIHADGNQILTAPGASGFNSDFNDAGAYSFQSLSGDYTFGAGTRGTTALTFAPTGKQQVTLNFIFYFVTPSDLYLIEADSDKSGNPTMFRLSGELILQQTNSPFDQTAMQGTSVASGTGVGTGGNASVFAGLLTSTLCDQNAAVTLAYDENNGGTLNGGAVPPISVAGTCAINSNGRVSFTDQIITAAQTRVAAAYLTGPGQGFLIGSDAAVTTGRLEQQTITSFAPTSFLGGYTLSTPFIAESGVKNVIGQTTADGVGTIAGTVDEIDPTAAAAPNLAQVLAGIFTNPAPNGRGALTATGTVPSGFPTDSIFYVVSPGSVRIISKDATDTHPRLILLDH